MDERRYRAAEQALWDHWRIAPVEHRVTLPSTGTTVRVLEVGDGPPLLFVHGATVAGSCWSDLASRFPDRRCLLLDRPGCGLSEPLPTPPGLAGLPSLADRLLVDVLDALDVARADLVSNSMGGLFTLRTAAAVPARVGSVVHVGWTLGAPLDELPLFMRVVTAPWLAAATSRLPVPRRAVLGMLRSTGLAGAIDGGLFPDVAVDWNHALQNHTDTRVHEYRIAAGAGLRQQIEALRLPEELLRAITAPVTVLFGDRDPFGAIPGMRQLVDQLPAGHLEVWEGAGHAVWLDDLDRAERSVRTALARA